MSFASNAVIAKARAVCGHSLGAEDYTQLTAKESVADVCAYLKQTERYGKALSSVNPQTVHRGQLESLLRKSLFDIFERFHSFDHTKSREFFWYIVTQLEIEQILSALQSVASGVSMSYIAALPMFLTEHSQLQLAALGMAKSFSEAAALLRGTRYEKTVCPALVGVESSGGLNIGEIERRLYTEFYLNMLKSTERDYKGAEKKDLKRLILGVIDMRNVVTLYRYSRLFGAGAQDAKDALIPFRRRLSDEAIERLAAEGDISRIAAELDSMGYGLRSQEIPATVEVLTDRINLDNLKKRLRLSQSSSVVYFAFMELLGFELKNIKTIIEGIRYGLDGSAILEMLVV